MQQDKFFVHFSLYYQHPKVFNLNHKRNIHKTNHHQSKKLFYFLNDNDYYLFKLKTFVVILMARIQNFVHTNQRIFKKTLSYYIMHITVAMLVGYLVTGNVWMAITLSLLEPTVQAVAFFFHEKVWNKKDAQAAQALELEAKAS